MARGMMPQIVAAARARGWTAPEQGILEPGAGRRSGSPPSRRRSRRRRRLGAAEDCGHPVPPHPDGGRSSVRADRRGDAGAGSAPRFPSRRSADDRQPGFSNSYAYRPPRHPALPVLRRPLRAGHVDVSPRRSRTRSSTASSACHCCIFPVVDGIPVLHLQPNAISRARAHRGRSSGAGAARDGRSGHRMASAEDAARFEAAAASESSTYRDIVEALGPSFEGGYFLYRFSDPDLHRRQRRGARRGRHGAARQAAGGGHLRRIGTSHQLADGSVVGRRRCLPICISPRSGWRAGSPRPAASRCAATATRPMPFARGAFGYAMCSDAFQYIWTKRQLIGEMSRLVDGPRAGCAS